MGVGYNPSIYHLVKFGIYSVDQMVIRCLKCLLGHAVLEWSVGWNFIIWSLDVWSHYMLIVAL